jgi:hypothetical protein
MAKRNRSNPQVSPPARAATEAQGAGAAGPCKLTPIDGASNAFQCKVTDMPISCALSSTDGKTEFLSAEVRQAGSMGTIVGGQPTALSASSFTLNLPAGDYVVIAVVGSLPSANPVWLTESCAAGTKLDWIAVPANTTGEFSLKAV